VGAGAAVVGGAGPVSLADPEIRRRILRSEAAPLAVHEAVELAVVQRMAEGRALRRWRT
jgi:hypothetical protein